MDGRRHINMAEISNAKGEVLARSTGTFIAIDPEKMFAQHGVPAGVIAVTKQKPIAAEILPTE